MDIEFYLIIAASVITLVVALLAKIKGDEKEKNLLMSQEKLLDSQAELSRAQKSLFELSQSNNDKSEKIISIQNIVQQKTEEIVEFQSRLQEKSDEVAVLNRRIISIQGEIIKDNEREINPLYPINFEMSFRIPFSSNMIPPVKKVALNKIISEVQKNKNSGLYGFEVVLNQDSGEVNTIAINDPIGSNYNGFTFGFITSKAVKVMLFENSDDIFSETPTSLIFSGFLSISHLIKNNSSNFILNLKENEIQANLNFEKMILTYPNKYLPTGYRDIINKYLVVSPFYDYNFDLISLNMYGGSGKTSYNLHCPSNKFAKKSDESGRVYFVYQIREADISTRIN